MRELVKVQQTLDQVLDYLAGNDIGLVVENLINNIDTSKTIVENLLIQRVSNCKRDETLDLIEEIMIKVKEANEEGENGIYDPMLECAKKILNNYKIERR